MDEAQRGVVQVFLISSLRRRRLIVSLAFFGLATSGKALHQELVGGCGGSDRLSIPVLLSLCDSFFYKSRGGAVALFFLTKIYLCGDQFIDMSSSKCALVFKKLQ